MQETQHVEFIDEGSEALEAAILEAFTASVEIKEEDAVKMDMISKGATFKNVTRLYNKFMIDAGLAISKSDRSQLIGWVRV